jgi:phage shock protein E
MTSIHLFFRIAIILLLALNYACTAPVHKTTEVKQISPSDFSQKDLKQKAVVIDVRTPEEYANGHVTGAINSDYRNGEFEEQLKNWDKNKSYYLYCASGNRSSKAAILLKDAGFKNIFDLGAYSALKEAGVSVESENNQ